MYFEKFVEDITLRHWNVHGVEVYQDGQLIHSYGDTHTKYPIYSATKTILSIAVGIALDQGRINLEKNILEYIPERFIQPMSPEQKENFRKISLHRLMTMSVEGFPFRPEGDSYLRFSLACKIHKPEEKRFQYGNIPAYLTGVALTEALGEDVWEFIKNHILTPLHISGAESTRCPDGYFYGASGMTLSVHDLSQVGLLLYQEGMYEGTRIVSSEYIKKAASVLQKNSGDGYGYFIWKYRDGFSISGKWKQKCYILPARGLVITFLSDLPGDSDDLLRSMERNLIV